MSGVTSNLVSQSLRLDGGDFITQSFVGLEIHGQLWIVLFNQSLGGTLDGLCSNSTLFKYYIVSKSFAHLKDLTFG